MKKKVLFIFPVLPYPFYAGGIQALYNSFDCVKDDVDVFVMYDSPFYKQKKETLKSMENATENVHVVPFVYNPLKGFCNFILWFFFRIIILLKLKKKNLDYYSSQLSSLFKIHIKEYVDFINKFILENKIDIVQMELCSTLSHVLTLPPNVKKVFVHHELNYVVNDLRIHQLGPSINRLANVELAKILEIGLLNKCDAIITLSEIDKQKLIDEGVKSPIYPSFAIVNTSTSDNNPNDKFNELSFVGPAFHEPNFIGLTWFLEKCWEKLLENNPSYTLKIIGNWPEEKRTALSQKYKNIQFLGFVPNLAEVLNNTIMIVPITVGSGIRMKILEAASLGVPFVSTSVGAEGLPFECGKSCFLSDTPEDFVESILKLKDKALREKFAQNANAIVKEKYSMDALRKNRLNIYKNVLNEKRNINNEHR